jgi:ribose transport system permease protein
MKKADNLKSNNKGTFFSVETKMGRLNRVLLFPVILVLFYFGMNFLVGGALMNADMFLLLVSQCVPYAFVAWGISFIWSAGPDFSTAAAFAISANVAAYLAMEVHLGFFGLIVGAIGTVIILQLISLKIRLAFGLPAWVAGLAMALIYESMGMIYLSARSAIGQTAVSLDSTTGIELIKMPWIGILLIVGLLVVSTIYNRTSFGMKYRAVSINEKVAGYMGIQKNSTLYKGAIVGSVFVGIGAAIILRFSAVMAPPSALGSFAMISKGLVAWLLSIVLDKHLSPQVSIMLSAFFVALLFFVMTNLGIPSGTWQDFVLGACVIVFGMLSQKNVRGVVK